jgi:hypothetical protein
MFDTHSTITTPPAPAVTSPPLATFTAPPIEPEPMLGGLVVTPSGLGGDPAVLIWCEAVARCGKVW